MKFSIFLSIAFLVNFLIFTSHDLFAVSRPAVAFAPVESIVGDELTESGDLFRKKNRDFNKHHSNRGLKNMNLRGLVKSLKTSLFRAGPLPEKVKEPGRKQAVAALVLGILGVTFLPIPCSIIAIALGASSLKKYKLGFHDEVGMAKAGIILGVVGLGLVFLYLGIFLLPLFFF